MNTIIPWKRNDAQNGSALSTTAGVPVRWDWDRIFDDMWSPAARAMPALALDIFETDEEITIHAEAPGVDPDALDIRLVEDVLTFSGRKDPLPQAEGMRRHYSERRFGAFERSVRLNCPVDPDSVVARHKNGVVTITLKKAETVRPKRIPINAA